MFEFYIMLDNGIDSEKYPVRFLAKSLPISFLEVICFCSLSFKTKWQYLTDYIQSDYKGMCTHNSSPAVGCIQVNTAVQEHARIVVSFMHIIKENEINRI